MPISCGINQNDSGPRVCSAEVIDLQGRSMGTAHRPAAQLGLGSWSELPFVDLFQKASV